MKLKWQEQEVTDPLGQLGVVFFFVIFLMLSPLWLVLHYLLRALGRQGFYSPHPDGSSTIEVSKAGFKRR